MGVLITALLGILLWWFYVVPSVVELLNASDRMLNILGILLALGVPVGFWYVLNRMTHPPSRREQP